MRTESAMTGPALPVRVGPPTDLLLEREAEAAILVSGPWSLSLRGAELDDIAYDGVLVLRSIRLVVRDEDWGTLPMHVDSTHPAAARQSAGLELTLRGRAGDLGGIATWTLTLRIDGSALRVDARVEATTPFRRNRLGLIVLHPTGLAGSPLTVEHPDGAVTHTVFPERISPHQPARDISALSWRSESAAGDHGHAVDDVLRFAGDVFEMEDQRNWTDASFKTYSTPLSTPFPVELSPGAVVEQVVELRCEASGPEGTSSGETAEPTRVRVAFGPADATARLPILTTSVSSGPVAAAPISAAFGPLVCEFDPAQPTWRAVLDRAVTESGGRPLDLRLIVGQVEEVDAVLDHLRDAGIATARIGVFDRRTHVSEPEQLTPVRKRLDERGIRAELLGGTRAHFTELNRNSSRLAEWDGPLTFSITPFMHDRGGHQLVESLAMQRMVVREALDIAHGRPLHVGPITLGARFNAVATSTPRQPRMNTLDEGFGAEFVDGGTDPRQHAPSLGAWVLGSVAALAVPGVASVSYFEGFGDRGFMDADGHATAAAAVLEMIAEFAGGTVAPIVSDHPAIVGLAVADASGETASGDTVAIVGNLGDLSLIVRIHGVGDLALEPGAVRRVTVRAT
ncbi:MAG: hypothetical protein JWQ59_2271 [Cryobacterium sp.]|nr:hypothetical protein [Cryobacterium sp.]